MKERAVCLLFTLQRQSETRESCVFTLQRQSETRESCVFTLKIPAMDSVRLEVRETSRNSEKPRLNASEPPTHSRSREDSRGRSSDTRNSFSDMVRVSPAHRQAGGREGERDR